MKGLCGYGRYDDDPQHVGCPRAKSDMTPCIARNGGTACADDGMCVGCGADPWDLLLEIGRAMELPAGRGGFGRRGGATGLVKHADRLRDLAWEATEQASPLS